MLFTRTDRKSAGRPEAVGRTRKYHALAWVSGLAVLGGCADRQGSIDAAADLAEATYPGQLQVVDTQLQKTYYDIIFAVKGDPFSRVRLQMDRDPSACQPGSACEKRLRQAYVEGRARGLQLKSMNEAFARCEVPLLATWPLNGGIAHVVELDLGLEDQQPALDRLAACTLAFAEVYGEPIRHNFRIFRPRDGTPAAAPDIVTPDTELSDEWRDRPSYWISADPARENLSQNDLRIGSEIFRSGPVHDQMVEAARALLRQRYPEGLLPWPNTFWKTQLDPTRVDLVRTYLMACSENREGRCRQDLAFRISYDFSTHAVSEIVLLDAPQGLGGLPELPGRGRAGRDRQGKVKP